MSRKKVTSKRLKESYSCPLNDLLWERIGETLRNQHRRFPDLWASVKRDKNTYTNWLKKRTIPKISDLQELAAALGRTPADLLSREDNVQSSGKMSEQLEFSFGMGPKAVQLEVQYTTAGLILKKLG